MTDTLTAPLVLNTIAPMAVRFAINAEIRVEHLDAWNAIDDIFVHWNVQLMLQKDSPANLVMYVPKRRSSPVHVAEHLGIVQNLAKIAIGKIILIDALNSVLLLVNDVKTDRLLILHGFMVRLNLVILHLGIVFS